MRPRLGSGPGSGLEQAPSRVACPTYASTNTSIFRAPRRVRSWQDKARQGTGQDKAMQGTGQDKGGGAHLV